MFAGYAQRFLFEARVTWMEMTCASAFWTSMVIFTMSGVKKHLVHEEMFQSKKRVAYRGHVFSAPMNVHDIAEQIDRVD